MTNRLTEDAQTIHDFNWTPHHTRPDLLFLGQADSYPLPGLLPTNAATWNDEILYEENAVRCGIHHDRDHRFITLGLTQIHYVTRTNTQGTSTRCVGGDLAYTTVPGRAVSVSYTGNVTNGWLGHGYAD